MSNGIQNIIKSLHINKPDFDCPAIGQTPNEVVTTLKVIQQLNPKVILEIGSAA